MLLLTYARQRLQAVIAEIERAYESDFPYPDSKDALDRLKERFEGELRTLDELGDNDPAVIATQCGVVLRDISDYLPLVGFILRSTTTRNSFEAFGPFLRLAVQLLEPGAPMSDRQTHLVLSSEWDYIPLIYHRVIQLDRFLFIGLPAPESSNPLLLPLAGHELGHALWHRQNLTNELSPAVQDAVVEAIQNHWSDYIQHYPVASSVDRSAPTQNLLTLPSIRTAKDWCLKQAEESFCDFVAVRMFAQSYLYAVAYLLSPSIGPRSKIYPEITVRVGRMVAVATNLGYPPADNIIDLFEAESALPASPAEQFLLQMVDEAVEQLTHQIVTVALSLSDKSPSASDDEVKRILLRYKCVAPAEGCHGLSGILNAAWCAYHDDELWKDLPKFSRESKLELLKELVLKNLEIFEIEQIQRS